MIALLQKTRALSKAILERMREGKPPAVAPVLPEIERELEGRRFGSPLTRLRVAVPGHPIGGEDGKDIFRTFTELRADLELLYEALVKLSGRTLDTYEVFAVRKDRLALRIAQLRLEVATLLAKQGAGGRATISDSFNTLEFIDPIQSTAVIDLDEGTATLPPNATASVGYDGSRVQLVRKVLPPGSVESGAPFQSVFTPYRLDAWYTTIRLGEEASFRINATGVDYERGATEEVPVNGLRIEPTGPMHVAVEWSPDGFNYHPLAPEVSRVLRGATTVYFEPVNLGYLQFRFRAIEEAQTGVGSREIPIGVKRIELYRRAFSTTATLQSREFRFSEPVHSAVIEVESSTPYGTRIIPYLAQSPEGPWQPAGGGPVQFQSITQQELPITTVSPEASGVLSSPWVYFINPSLQPLPGTGEMIVGRNQVEIAAFPFDWRQMNDRTHIPEKEDWLRPMKETRAGFFESIGGIGSDITSTSFSTAKSPLAVDTRVSSWLVLAIVQGDGTFILQPGYNYRLRTYVWCPTATTLEDQQIGVVNNAGVEGTVIAPFSVYVNGTRIFQQDRSTVSSAGLSGAAYRATIPLLQGFNEVELLLQLPADLQVGQGGVAGSNVFLYFQPNLFSANLERDLGIQYIQAYEYPLRRRSEFDLRYNIPIGDRSSWAWKTEFNAETDIPQVVAALFPYDITNSRGSATLHPSYRTIDGVNAGSAASHLLRYPTELQDQDYRRLFCRFDLVMDPGSSTPPVIAGYRVLVNSIL